MMTTREWRREWDKLMANGLLLHKLSQQTSIEIGKMSSYHFSFLCLNSIFHSQFTFFSPFIRSEASQIHSDEDSTVKKEKMFEGMRRESTKNGHRTRLWCFQLFYPLLSVSALLLSLLISISNVSHLSSTLSIHWSSLISARISTISMKTNNIDIKWHFNLFTQDEREREKRRQVCWGWTKMNKRINKQQL